MIGHHRYLNIFSASSFLDVSLTSSTSTFVWRDPNWIWMISPGFTFAEAFAALSLTRTLPASQASLATVLRLIRRDTFKNLSSLIKIPHVLSRACLKNHSRQPHAPLCGIFAPHSVSAARYAALIRNKSSTNCDAQLT